MTTLKDEISQNTAAAFAVFEEINRIKTQLSHAKAKTAASGTYSDSEWFQAASCALRHKQIEHQRLLAHGGELKQRLKEYNVASAAKSNSDADACFKMAAKNLLTGLQFVAICQEADRIRIEMGGEG